jgi:hypothetical protein
VINLVIVEWRDDGAKKTNSREKGISNLSGEVMSGAVRRIRLDFLPQHRKEVGVATNEFRILL